MDKTEDNLYDQLIRTEDVRRLFQISRQTEYKWLKSGVFPRSVKIKKTRYYFKSDINQVIKNLTTIHPKPDEKK